MTECLKKNYKTVYMYLNLNEETQNISHDKVQDGTSLYNSFAIPLQINFAARGKKVRFQCDAVPG